ncbi:MAG: hypothetical protein ACREID_08510 [Planctomycetota bacterium]
MGRRRRALLLIAILAAAAGVVAFAPPSWKWIVKTRGPTSHVYEWLNRVRDPWKGPEEAGDGRPAREILLLSPMGLAEDGAGNVYVSDRGRFVWRIGADAVAHVVAGTGRRGVARVERSARGSHLGSPEGICLDAAGDLYLCDSHNHVVLKIDVNGWITRVAGAGRPGYGGDGGPARDALFHEPYDVRRDAGGNLYVADYRNNRIRRIDPRGIVTTVAGTGEAGYSGDGGPATRARLRGPYGVFVDPRGGLLVADTYNNVVRRVDASGTITTVAGRGEAGYSGDGGPAAQARLDAPQSLFVDGAGRLLVGDEHNHCVRAVAPDGTITTLAGAGRRGLSPDGVRAAGAPLDDPENLWVRPDGSVLFTETGNGLLRAVAPDGTLRTLAGRGR